MEREHRTGLMSYPGSVQLMPRDQLGAGASEPRAPSAVSQLPRLLVDHLDRLAILAAMPTAARVARNESLFREVNERIRDLEEHFGQREPDHSLASFVCECATTGCTTRVAATLEEYQLARRRPARFLLAPGHARPEFERIVLRTERFELAEKLGEAGEIAAADAE